MLTHHKWSSRAHGIKARNISLYIYNVLRILYWNKINEPLTVATSHGRLSIYRLKQGSYNKVSSTEKNITNENIALKKTMWPLKEKKNNWPDSIKLSISRNHNIIICIDASINLNSFFLMQRKSNKDIMQPNSCLGSNLNYT